MASNDTDNSGNHPFFTLDYPIIFMPLLKRILIISGGGFILSLVALYNGFPLVFSDTGTYIYSGFDVFIPKDRPIIYGLFIRLTSFEYSTWLVILCQNLLTAYIVFETLKLFNFNANHLNRFYFAILLFLVLFTGIGWYSNQLMPDFLTPIAILSMFILLKRKQLSIPSQSFLALVLILSLVSHFSHLIIGTALIFGFTFLKVLFRSHFIQIPFSRVMKVSLVVLSGWLILPGVNYLVEQKFMLSKGSHVFIMAHLADTGILQQYLKENCNKSSHQDYRLCQYKDSLPTDLASFLWGNNIVENTGGWGGSKEEYNAIIKETLTQPNYLALNIYRSVTYGLIQLAQINVGEGLTAYVKGSAPYGQISWRFPNELNNYLNSRQNKWDGVNLQFDLINIAQLILIVFSLFGIILIGFRHALPLLDDSTKLFVVFVVLSILINSFATAGLNAPTERFQARVIWLFPFAMLILFTQNFKMFVKSAFPSKEVKF